MQRSLIVLSDADVRGLLDLGACLDTVERAFRLHGEQSVPPPLVATQHLEQGGFHIKAGIFPEDNRSYFVVKTNGNFPLNPARHGLPTIQGTITLHDAERGTPLAVMDSGEITALRTAAATAVAARYLARDDAATAAIIGCGRQGRVQLAALARVRRLRRVALFDVDRAAAEGMAADASLDLGIDVSVAPSIPDAVRDADMCVTCTPAEAFLLDRDMVRAGAFVAGVGADAEHKRELAPALLAGATVVTDVTEQCAAFGDLHHAIAAGVMTRDQVHAELGEIVAGRKPGRRRDEEIIVFDSTGMALQDAAAAAVAYERALLT